MHHDIELRGHGVRLMPLGVEHAEPLDALTDDALWAGMTKPRPLGPEAYAEHIRSQLDEPATFAFAVVDEATGTIMGTTCLYDYVPSQKRIEIGSTWYGRQFWGGRTNPAAKLLLFEHAFDTLGLQRVALRCDARNLRSAAAIERLGAVPEGILRSHRVAADGSRGDTAYFSVIAEEWPAVRAGLESRLA